MDSPGSGIDSYFFWEAPLGQVTPKKQGETDRSQHKNQRAYNGDYRHGPLGDLAMQIRDSVAFVTGANRGIGLVFAPELLAAGARVFFRPMSNCERLRVCQS
jgi:hypothetical protein